MKYISVAELTLQDSVKNTRSFSPHFSHFIFEEALMSGISCQNSQNFFTTMCWGWTIYRVNIPL